MTTTTMMMVIRMTTDERRKRIIAVGALRVDKIFITIKSVGTAAEAFRTRQSLAERYTLLILEQLFFYFYASVD